MPTMTKGGWQGDAREGMKMKLRTQSRSPECPWLESSLLPTQGLQEQREWNQDVVYESNPGAPGWHAGVLTCLWLGTMPPPLNSLIIKVHSFYFNQNSKL